MVRIFRKAASLNHDIRVAILALVRRAAIAAVIVATSCSVPGPNGKCQNTTMETSVSVAALATQRVDAAGLDDQVARCQADAGDCLPLCQRVLEPNPYAYTYVTCELVPADGGLLVHVVYSTPCPL
jgi:hypothetical protein